MTPRTLVTAALVFAHVAFAQSGPPIRVFASNGVKAVLEELQPQIERSTKSKLTIQWGTTSSLKQRAATESFDVALLTSEAVDELVKSGALGSRTDLARCGIGVGVKTGAAKPDIKTSESIKQTLQKAKTVTYAQDGASRPFLEKMFASFGIADAMKPKTMLTAGSGAATSNVAQGRSEIVMTLVSEIAGVPGVDLVGPLPKEQQGYVSFAAGVSPKAANAEAAKAMLKAMTGASAAPVYKSKGMEPR